MAELRTHWDENRADEVRLVRCWFSELARRATADLSLRHRKLPKRSRGRSRSRISVERTKARRVVGKKRARGESKQAVGN